jgi:hypothetical protein
VLISSTASWPAGGTDSGEQLCLADLLGGLSIVADSAAGLPPEQAMPSGLIGTALARGLGGPEPEVADAFYASVLVQVGCTGFSRETAAVFGDELRAPEPSRGRTSRLRRTS